MKAINSNIKLDTSTAKQFCHLTCGSDWLQCKWPYDTTWLNNHLKSCSNMKPKKTAGMPSVENWSKVFSINLKDQCVEPPLEKVPCPGLTAADDPCISTYFECSGALYGGAESISVISMWLFSKLFSQLWGHQLKKQAIDTQNLQSKWHCDHHDKCIYSCIPECLHWTSQRKGEHDLPCTNCQALLSNQQLKDVLQKPMPQDKDLRHTNTQWHLPKKLVGLFACINGLREIFEEMVSSISQWYCAQLTSHSIECREHAVYQICHWCTCW